MPGAVGEAADEAFVTVLSLGPSFAIKVEQKYDFFQKIHTFAFKIIFRYSMSHKQRTLKAPVVFRGKGLHTGLDVTMTINPADSGCGIRFRRIDLEGQPFVDALAENRSRYLARNHDRKERRPDRDDRACDGGPVGFRRR